MLLTVTEEQTWEPVVSCAGFWKKLVVAQVLGDTPGRKARGFFWATVQSLKSTAIGNPPVSCIREVAAHGRVQARSGSSKATLDSIYTSMGCIAEMLMPISGLCLQSTRRCIGPHRMPIGCPQTKVGGGSLSERRGHAPRGVATRSDLHPVDKRHKRDSLL